MHDRYKNGAVNDLVHQQLRQRLTPYRELRIVRAARDPGWRWLAYVAGAVWVATLLYLLRYLVF